MAGEPIEIDRKGPPDWLVARRDDAIKDCRILYLGRRKPLTESLMPFGWECGHGWNDPLSKLSYCLEEINLRLYPKYRIRCEAEQVKEKFGTLRFYYRIATDPPAWRAWLPDLLGRLCRRLERLKIDYAFKRVVDSPKHFEYSYKEMTKTDWDRAEKGRHKCSNVDYFEAAGRYYSVTKLEHMACSRLVPTRHLAVYWFRRAVWALKCSLGAWSEREPSAEQRVVAEYADAAARDLVRRAEEECYCKCEECGTDIGDGGWSPRCETAGWILYLCEKCASRKGSAYIKNGKRYIGGEEQPRKGPDSEDKD